MTKAQHRVLICLCGVLLTASLGTVWSVHRHVRAEARRWRDTQRAGGIPRFWEKVDWITATLMNPPGSRHGVTTDEGQSVIKRIECHGFAEDQDVPLLRNTQRRIFCIGDSVTFGVLPNAQSFPDLLESMLQSPQDSWQIVNAGKGGESTYTALLRYKHVVSSYDADGIVVGWFAGNEPIEMTREGVYTGPRVKKDANGWYALWEDDTPFHRISQEDVNVLMAPLEEYVRARRRVLARGEQEPMDFVREGSSEGGMISSRYALYGGTSFISAFRFLRYKPGRRDSLHGDLQRFVVRSLAVVREFRNRVGERLLYVVIPEACEVEIDLVRSHPDFQAMLNVLDLSEEDLSMAAYLREWFMGLLRREGVPYVDPAHDMKRTARNSAVFRIGDLHPTMKGNVAIAESIANQSNAFKTHARMPPPEESRTR